MPDQALPVSIVIPARNEAARLPASLREILRTFPDEPWEFLIVVEKSDDDTARLARSVVADDRRFVIVENSEARGKGFAVRTGMLRARGDWIFFMDADLSVPLPTVRRFLDASDTGDVLIGNRRHAESLIAIRQPLLREACGRIFSYVLRGFGATRIRDTQCGFKAFRRDAAREIFSRVRQDGFGFDVEAVILAEVLGFRLVELPVEWADAAGSKVRPLRDGVGALIDAVLAAKRIRREHSSDGNSRSQY
ncbi:MAG: dolichyl-phosphate beta-glucosyltransferase [Terrimicrobiaceae bacterium]